jgi:archaellum component FlaC
MKDIIAGFREIIQDLLVPELRSIKTELQHHSKQFEQIEKRFEHIDKQFEQIDRRFEQVFKGLEDLKLGQKEILSKLDIDKRLTRLETIVEKSGLVTGGNIIREKESKYLKK